ncbi:hypothetical protein LguiB_018594 [Lonicera macranthoides]
MANVDYIDGSFDLSSMNKTTNSLALHHHQQVWLGTFSISIQNPFSLSTRIGNSDQGSSNDTLNHSSNPYLDSVIDWSISRTTS